jgi:hypothetical protein
MAGNSFKVKIDISEWRKAAGFAPDSQGDAYAANAFERKGEIKIAAGQPINTYVFEEVVVLEENGVPTAEGLKERLNNHPHFVKEGEMKPIIDFINRL